MRFSLLFVLIATSLVVKLPAQESSGDPGEPVAEALPEALPAAEGDQRTELSLLGQTNSGAGESRRNENVQFNAIDNNALKELNLRLGTTATIVGVFEADRKYFGAEYGNSPRGPIHRTSPPAGGQGIHGQLFYQHLNSATSARSFFQVGSVAPARENEYGFDLAAPLWRGARLAVNGGQAKIRGSVNGNVLIPLPHERTPLTTDPELAAVVNRIMSAYPAVLPNRTDISERMLNTNSEQVIDNNIAGGRIDQRLGDSDQLVLGYDFLTQNVDAFQFVKGQNPDMYTRSQAARATWTRTWSPATMTDFSAAYDRVGSMLNPEENFIGMRVSPSGVLAKLGPGNSIPINRSQNDYQAAGKVSQMRGNHQLFAGFGVLRRQINGVESDARIGNYNFSNNFGNDTITNLRLGKPSSYYKGVGHLHRGFRFWFFNGYVGDRWAVTPQLNLTLGLRWEGQPRPSEVNNLNEFPYDGDLNNFSPMFSFAYQLSERWGVLRGAYGLHYGEVFSVTAQQIRFNAPLYYKMAVQEPDLLDPSGGITYPPPADTRSVWYTFSEDLATPYSHQYNFSWEFPLFQEMVVQLGYVGSRSPKLLHHWYSNRAHPVDGVPTTPGTIDERRADPKYSDIRRVVNGSIGYFDAAKATVVLPRAGGLSGEVSYWFSKSMDLGASYTNTAQDTDSFLYRGQYEYDMHGDVKGVSRFHQPHSFLARGSYELPYRGRGSWAGAVFGDWIVSGVVLLKTGTPFDVLTGSDGPGYGNVDGQRSDRPNVLDPSILGRGIDHPDRSQELLPHNAFSFIPLNDHRGNLGRNVFHRGPIRNVNMALSKSWRMRTEKEITFRAESVNFFNTAQFAQPGTSLTDSNFGAITNTLNEGRTFRFTLRFSF